MTSIAELENKLNHALDRIADLEAFIPRNAKKFERFTAKGYRAVTREDVAHMIEMSRDKYNTEG